MAAPQGPWSKSTTNKTDHGTQGFTSKVIFNYQWFAQDLGVASGEAVINSIVNNFDKQYKGNNQLPPYYFEGNNGRCFRIIMYYRANYDGATMSLTQQLIDKGNNVTYDMDSENSFDIQNNQGSSLLRYEGYLSYYKSDANDDIIQTIGSVMFPPKSGGDQMVTLIIDSYDQLSYGTGATYVIDIRNTGNGTIYPISLLIEEIS